MDRIRGYNVRKLNENLIEKFDVAYLRVVQHIDEVGHQCNQVGLDRVNATWPKTG